MAISEIINLGVKGADLVVSQLKKIQEQKENLSGSTTVNLSAGVQGKLEKMGSKPGDYTNLQERLKNREDRLITRKEALQKKEEKTATKQGQNADKEAAGGAEEAIPEVAMAKAVQAKFDSIGNTLAGIGQGAATLSGAELGKSIASAIGGPLGAIGNLFIGGAMNLASNIQQANSLVADTAAAQAAASRFGRGVEAGSGHEFLYHGTRSDVSREEQRGILQNLGAQYGRMTEQFSRFADSFYGTNEKKFNIEQTTQMLGGNTASLGTDQGFFTQKILDGLKDLPPTIRQALTEQVLKTIPESDRAMQTDAAARTAVTAQNEESRRNAQNLANNPEAQEAARTVQQAQNRASERLNDVMARLVIVLEGLASRLGLTLPPATGRAQP